MSRRDTHGEACTLTTGSVDDSAELVLAAGNGRIEVKVKNTHGSQTLTLGPASDTAATEGDRFIGGTLAAGETFTIGNYVGAIYGIGSGASTTYTLQVIA